MKFCHWDGVETDQENLQDLSTVLTIKMMCLTMKLERVLTMKIADNFVRFGMPYRLGTRLPPPPQPRALPATTPGPARHNPGPRPKEIGEGREARHSRQATPLPKRRGVTRCQTYLAYCEPAVTTCQTDRCSDYLYWLPADHNVFETRLSRYGISLAKPVATCEIGVWLRETSTS